MDSVTLPTFRKDAETSPEEDLKVQLDVFDEQKASDDEQLPQSTTEGLDLSSHSDIFTAILKQVILILFSSWAPPLCFIG